MKIIKKVEIKHFRSVFDQTITELSDFNVFGGQNDSGKSNALKALNLFFNNQTSFLEEFEFRSDFSIFSRIKARESKKGRQYISIKIYFDPSEIKGKTELKKLAKTSGENEGLWIERKWWAYSEDGSYEQTVPNYIKNAPQGIKRSFSIFLQSIKFVYIPAFKSEDVFSYILKLSAKNEGLFLSKNAKNELDESIAETTREFSSSFSDLTNIDTSVTLPISLESFWSTLEVNSQFEGTPESLRKGESADYKIKFTSRGEGIKSLFIPVVLGWLSKKAIKDHWIWGIDEPENALEALRADNLFNKFLEYANYAQIFVSTHSPSFIFPINDYSNESQLNHICRVFITRQDVPGNSIFEPLKGRASELERVFGYDYGSFLGIQKEYSESIKKQEYLKQEINTLRSQIKPVLFVEGPTDKIIIENAWTKLHDKKSLPFIIIEKNFAKGVNYALEHATTLQNLIILGLFDFDKEGFEQWNGLTKKGFTVNLPSTPENCLIKKRIDERHFALLLPVPATGDIRKQIINPTTGEHFGNGSSLSIELMFVESKMLSKFFKDEVTAGGGSIKVFNGDKMSFAKNTSKLDSSDFKNFVPLLKTVLNLCK